ncbi:NADPH-dependent FMN reductase [Piscinibacter sakaiensis]|uniref:Putative NADPH-dependent FMN reductase n=1 Tax=Piscinibacter sakaiensis TaxID=1547922 RepID=A0A0K8NY32_PISS1|nr:NADPH-dependent FMN reductase [Piscinibacter sakaiensis]GAP35189.1 putative NADPH-dependent FMN reductase [Piscinibacter sakaiensis]
MLPAPAPLPDRPLIVGIGGSTRPGSTAERAIEAALAQARALGCDTLAFGADALPTEPYDPTRPERSDKARALVDAVRRADGLVLATPAYHGGISGLMKNVIDFVEDTREDARPYLTMRAVGCIVSADGMQAMGTTLTALRSVVHALRGWPTPYGAALLASSRPFGGAEQPADPAALAACHRVAEEVVGFAALVRGAAAVAPAA